MHRADHVIVKRKNNSAPRNGGRFRKPEWTLHRADCFYLVRTPNVTTLPAPQTPYPGTVACKLCKPDQEQE